MIKTFQKVIILIFAFLKTHLFFRIKNQYPSIFKHYISNFLLLFLLSKAHRVDLKAQVKNLKDIKLDDNNFNISEIFK